MSKRLTRFLKLKKRKNTELSEGKSSATHHSETSDGQVIWSADNNACDIIIEDSHDNRSGNMTPNGRTTDVVQSPKRRREQIQAARNFIRLLDVEAFLSKLHKFNVVNGTPGTVGNDENPGRPQFEFSQETPQKRSNKFMLHELRTQPQCIQQKLKLPHMDEDEIKATKLSGNHRITDIAKYGEKLRENESKNSSQSFKISALGKFNLRSSGKNKTKKKPSDAKTKKRFMIWRNK